MYLYTSIYVVRQCRAFTNLPCCVCVLYSIRRLKGTLPPQALAQLQDSQPGPGKDGLWHWDE